MISEEDIQVFVEGVERYFSHINDESLKVGTPYLVENFTPTCLDYTGIIGISGAYKGCVYFTAPALMLRYMLIAFGSKKTNAEAMLDLVGDVANTISGNARATYGESFSISVPLLITGQLNNVHFPEDSRSYVIPIEWNKKEAAIVVCLRDS